MSASRASELNCKERCTSSIAIGPVSSQPGIVLKSNPLVWSLQEVKTISLPCVPLIPLLPGPRVALSRMYKFLFDANFITVPGKIVRFVVPVTSTSVSM